MACVCTVVVLLLLLCLVMYEGIAKCLVTVQDVAMPCHKGVPN